MFDTVIGLEVHVQLKTRSKIFCSCSTEFESLPNTNICPVCCGYPGSLPVFNREALSLGTRVAAALNCRINESIYFERKNYFYPDLPKNYQISQYACPLGCRGFLELSSGKKIGIDRVHLEEDAGKLIHKKDYSLADFNRAGVPLLEIVSLPQITSPQEAFDYLSWLKLTLQYIEASTCDMEKGYLRCDANISLKEKGSDTFGTKVELKNMNSFKGVKTALEYETKRQAEELKNKRKIVQETRLWDAEKLRTFSMRTKEEACDYRYFPDPDLPVFAVTDEIKKKAKRTLKNLEVEPGAQKGKGLEARNGLEEGGGFSVKKICKDLEASYGLTGKEVNFCLENKKALNFFKDVLNNYNQPGKVKKMFFGPFLEQINLLDNGIDSAKISPKDFAKVVEYFEEKKINNVAVKKILSLAVATGQDVDRIINRKQLAQVSDQKGLGSAADKVLTANSKAVKEYREGKAKAIQFLVGQMMKETKGRANPQLAREILERRLNQ